MAVQIPAGFDFIKGIGMLMHWTSCGFDIKGVGDADTVHIPWI